jgi:hypothetical protein
MSAKIQFQNKNSKQRNFYFADETESEMDAAACGVVVQLGPWLVELSLSPV